MARDDLARLVAELVQRVERLETRSPAPAPISVIPEDGDAYVTYSGSGPWRERKLVWQIIRGWRDVCAETGDRSATIFTALANPSRLRIITELMDGDLTTADLARRLDQPSTGQLFHHLKELLAAGVIYQPIRATYAIRKEHVIPLLTLLCAVLDIRSAAATEA